MGITVESTYRSQIIRSSFSKPAARALWIGAILLLPSLAWSLFYHTPKLVVDVLLLWSMEPFLSRAAQILLRTSWISLCGTMLLLEWNIYPESYLFYLGMLPSISDSRQGLAVIVTLALLVIFIFVPIGPARIRSPAHMLLAMLLFYACVTAVKLSPWGRENLVNLRLPVLRALQVSTVAGNQIGSVSVVGNGDATEVHGNLHERIRDIPAEGVPQKILMVMLESWGETPAGLKQLMTWLGNDTVTVLQHGYTPYRGSTLPGEVRELCGRQLDFREIGFSGEGCIALNLKGLGFHTTAYHGYEGFFYYRNVIYSALGFEAINFRPQLNELAQCSGAFTGACDDAVVDTAVQQLFLPGKQFVYVMSLTAHEPVSAEALVRPYVRRVTHPSSLNNTQLVNRALIQHTVQQVQAKSMGHGVPVWIYFAGDHNPPSDAEELQGLPAGQVPYVLIQIKSEKFQSRSL